MKSEETTLEEPWNKEPRLLPFLPLLYVAWADGELNAAEISGIQKAIEANDLLDEKARRTLDRWLDPAKPPTVREMTSMLRTIREGAAKLGPGARPKLVDLGVEVAKAHAPKATRRWLNAETRAALEQVESALGVLGNEAARELLPVEKPSKKKPVASSKVSFDQAAMTKLLEGKQAKVRHQVFALLADPAFERPIEIDTARYREKVLGWLQRLAEAGLGELAYPEILGKPGQTMASFVAAFEAVAHFDLSLLVKFGVQFGLFGGSIRSLGTKPHHDKYLARIARAELLGCFAMTELGHGSNVRDLGTVARFDKKTGEFVIHTPNEAARKEFIGNAALHARLAVVFAQLEIEGESQGVHAFLVPIRDAKGKVAKGVRTDDCGHKLGLNGVDNGRLWFDEVRIPRANLLNRFADVAADGTYSSPIPSPSKRFFTMIGTLVGGRVSIACAGLAVAKQALTIAIRYAAKRRQFGPAGGGEVPILDYRAQQDRLLRPLAVAYAAHFALEHLAQRFVETTEDTQELESLAAGLKAFTTRFATDTIQACRESCGGQGFMAANRFAGLKADSDVFTTFEGDNTVLLQLVARGLLTRYRKQFSNLRFVGIMKYLADAAATAVVEMNPVTTRRTDEAHLRDSEFHLAAFRYREITELGALARRLKKRLDAGVDSFEASNECQLHMISLAESHVELVLLVQLLDASHSCKNPELKKVLGLLEQLYALDRIERDSSWFIENGYIERGKVRAIRKLVETLCAEVREHALTLVNAFGIPENLLGAPIAYSEHFEAGG